MKPEASSNPSSSVPWWRRQKIILSRSQLKYAGMIMLGVMFVTTMMSFMLFGYLHDQARQIVMHQASPQPFNPWRSMLTVFLSAACFSGIWGLAFGLWSLIVSHRLFGPVTFMQRLMNDIADGRFPEQRPLRKKDEFKDLYSAFWRMVDGFREDRHQDLERLNGLKALLSDGEKGLDRVQVAAITARIEAMQSEIRRGLGEGGLDSSEMTQGTRIDRDDARSVDAGATHS